MTAPDEVKAGRYELVASLWEEPISKPGDPYQSKRHVKGDMVNLNVEEARRLLAAGAVVKPGELQRARVEAAKAQLQAALAGLPPDLREQVSESDLTPPEPQPSVAPGGPGPTTGLPRKGEPVKATDL